MKIKISKNEFRNDGWAIGLTAFGDNDIQVYRDKWVTTFEASNTLDAVKVAHDSLIDELTAEYNRLFTNTQLIGKELINGEIVKIWHDNEKPIQVIAPNIELLRLVKDYPDMIELKNIESITMIEEADNHYFYMSFILDEHRQRFLAYNFKINEKN